MIMRIVSDDNNDDRDDGDDGDDNGDDHGVVAFETFLYIKMYTSRVAGAHTYT